MSYKYKRPPKRDNLRPIIPVFDHHQIQAYFKFITENYNLRQQFFNIISQDSNFLELMFQTIKDNPIYQAQFFLIVMENQTLRQEAKDLLKPEIKDELITEPGYLESLIHYYEIGYANTFDNFYREDITYHVDNLYILTEERFRSWNLIPDVLTPGTYTIVHQRCQRLVLGTFDPTIQAVYSVNSLFQDVQVGASYLPTSYCTNVEVNLWQTSNNDLRVQFLVNGVAYPHFYTRFGSSKLLTIVPFTLGNFHVSQYGSHFSQEHIIIKFT